MMIDSSGYSRNFLVGTIITAAVLGAALTFGKYGRENAISAEAEEDAVAFFQMPINFDASKPAGMRFGAADYAKEGYFGTLLKLQQATNKLQTLGEETRKYAAPSVE